MQTVIIHASWGRQGGFFFLRGIGGPPRIPHHPGPASETRVKRSGFSHFGGRPRVPGGGWAPARGPGRAPPAGAAGLTAWHRSALYPLSCVENVEDILQIGREGFCEDEFVR